jgi:AcrR family transcriptional regulator
MIDKKAEIFRCGKEIFSKKGFKETKISDITEMAGVAVGSFYSFYGSKEDLFLDIYLEANAKLKARIMETVDFDEAPAVAIKKTMAVNLAGMAADPILREWYNREVFARIERCYRERNGQKDAETMHDISADLVRRWQEKGKIRTDIDFEMILALFHALINVDLHKEEIGIEFFPEIMDHLADFIFSGLSVKRTE